VTDEHDEGDFVYLGVDDALEIYAAIFGLTVTQAADHLRSRDALEGALGRPAAYAHYQEADLALQGAVLAHGIAETQSFVDGNKREALIALITFLELNGYVLVADDPELASWIISFSAGATPEEVGAQLRARLKRVT
jgi:death-on-curing family protein